MNMEKNNLKNELIAHLVDDQLQMIGKVLLTDRQENENRIEQFTEENDIQQG